MSSRPPPSPASPGPGEPPGGVSIAPGVHVPEAALRFAYSRSGGPGGQNVNKVSTKAELRIAMDDLPIPGRAKGRLRRLAGKRIAGSSTVTDEFGHTREIGGELVLVSETERSQGRNRDECLDKLRALIIEAMHEPKVRRKTRPTRGSVERRIEEKKRRGGIKRDRRTDE